MKPELKITFKTRVPQTHPQQERVNKAGLVKLFLCAAYFKSRKSPWCSHSSFLWWKRTFCFQSNQDWLNHFALTQLSTKKKKQAKNQLFVVEWYIFTMRRWNRLLENGASLTLRSFLRPALLLRSSASLSINGVQASFGIIVMPVFPVFLCMCSRVCVCCVAGR